MENFNDAKKIKNKRASNFMGTATEIKNIPKPAAQVVKKEVAPVPVNRAPAVEKVAQEVKPVVNTPPASNPLEDKLTIQKGFIVGKTEDGRVLFKPFGNPDKLELIGFVEYAKAISGDLLNELANTTTNEIRTLKTGVAAALQGLKTLLNKQDTKAA